MNIGDKIRKIRESKDYSQEYMATKLKITQPSYARLESGCTRLSIDRLEKRAELLEVRTEVLIKMEDRFMLHQTDHSEIPGYAAIHQTADGHVKTIAILEHEVKDLREERNRLLSIIEKFSK